jgi:hypothetical protein
MTDTIDPDELDRLYQELASADATKLDHDASNRFDVMMFEHWPAISAALRERDQLREELRQMKREAFDLVYHDPSVSTVLFQFVGTRVDQLLGDDG